MINSFIKFVRWLVMMIYCFLAGATGVSMITESIDPVVGLFLLGFITVIFAGMLSIIDSLIGEDEGCVESAGD